MAKKSITTNETRITEEDIKKIEDTLNGIIGGTIKVASAATADNAKNAANSDNVTPAISALREELKNWSQTMVNDAIGALRNELTSSINNAIGALRNDLNNANTNITNVSNSIGSLTDRLKSGEIIVGKAGNGISLKTGWYCNPGWNDQVHGYDGNRCNFDSPFPGTPNVFTSLFLADGTHSVANANSTDPAGFNFEVTSGCMIWMAFVQP